jgi:branched-chain amino acid transport system substrate-binding protein
MDPADAKTFLAQFNQNPTKSVVEVGYVLSIKGFADVVGKAGENVLGISTNSILPDENGDAFRQRFEEEFGEQPGLSIVGTVYDGVNLWAEAVKEAGDPDDYDKVAAAMTGLGYRGVNGTYAFTEGNIVPAADAEEGLPMFFFQIQDGELALLNVGTEQHEAFVMPSWVK